MKTQMKLAPMVQLGFGGIFLLMLVIGVVSKLSMSRLTQATEWVTHTYQVQAKLNELEKILVDAETGQRGFIYTGKTNFLEPYNRTKANLDGKLNKLSVQISDNPEQLKRLQVVKNLIKQKMNELDRTVLFKKNGKEAELKALVISEKGKGIMDNIRTKINEMMQVEENLLAQRKQTAKQAEFVAQSVIIVGTSIAILVGCYIVIFIARKIVQPINQVVSRIASSSTEIAVTVEQHERTASQQVYAAHQTAAAMDELSASSRQSAEQAQMSAEGAQQAQIKADEGTEAVEQTLSEMAALKETVEAIAVGMLHLNQQADRIGNISNLVSELANQTNMLALNAAVEAVRAGEHGKGFGVVASEIRQLADQSKKSAEKINVLVADIQKAINSTAIVTDRGSTAVKSGMEIAEKTSAAFAGVNIAINEVLSNSQKISLSAKQQAVAIQQVMEAMNALNQAAIQTATGISQTKVETQKLNETALSLRAIV